MSDLMEMDVTSSPLINHTQSIDQGRGAEKTDSMVSTPTEHAEKIANFDFGGRRDMVAALDRNNVGLSKTRTKESENDNNRNEVSNDGHEKEAHGIYSSRRENSKCKMSQIEGLLQKDGGRDGISSGIAGNLEGIQSSHQWTRDGEQVKDPSKIVLTPEVVEECCTISVGIENGSFKHSPSFEKKIIIKEVDIGPDTCASEAQCRISFNGTQAEGNEIKRIGFESLNEDRDMSLMHSKAVLKQFGITKEGGNHGNRINIGILCDSIRSGSALSSGQKKSTTRLDDEDEGGIEINSRERISILNNGVNKDKADEIKSQSLECYKVAETEVGKGSSSTGCRRRDSVKKVANVNASLIAGPKCEPASQAPHGEQMILARQQPEHAIDNAAQNTQQAPAFVGMQQLLSPTQMYQSYQRIQEFNAFRQLKRSQQTLAQQQMQQMQQMPALHLLQQTQLAQQSERNRTNQRVPYIPQGMQMILAQQQLIHTQTNNAFQNTGQVPVFTGTQQLQAIRLNQDFLQIQYANALKKLQQKQQALAIQQMQKIQEAHQIQQMQQTQQVCQMQQIRHIRQTQTAQPSHPSQLVQHMQQSDGAIIHPLNDASKNSKTRSRENQPFRGSAGSSTTALPHSQVTSTDLPDQTDITTVPPVRTSNHGYSNSSAAMMLQTTPKVEGGVINPGYNDYSGIDVPQIKLGGKGRVFTPFPVKLHQILDQVEVEGLDHIVSWQPHGRCFKIHKPKEFVNQIMPKCFNHSKMESFNRQLQIYGFKRFTGGIDKGGWYHEKFLWGKLGLAYDMKRTRVKGTGVTIPAHPESEPNFYLMSLLTESDSVIVKPMERDNPKKTKKKLSEAAASSVQHLVDRSQWIVPPGHGGLVHNPNINDVISHSRDHQGNIRFNALAESFKNEYFDSRTNALERRKIIERLVELVRCSKPAGRFLKRDGESGAFLEIGDVKAWQKAILAVRKAKLVKEGVRQRKREKPKASNRLSSNRNYSNAPSAGKTEIHREVEGGIVTTFGKDVAGKTPPDTENSLNVNSTANQNRNTSVNFKASEQFNVNRPSIDPKEVDRKLENTQSHATMTCEPNGTVYLFERSLKMAEQKKIDPDTGKDQYFNSNETCDTKESEPRLKRKTRSKAAMTDVKQISGSSERKDATSKRNRSAPKENLSCRQKKSSFKFTWQQRYEQLKKYKAEHKTCNVSIHNDLGLHLWTIKQRRDKKNCVLARRKVFLLSLLNFQWHCSESSSSVPIANATPIKTFKDVKNHFPAKLHKMLNQVKAAGLDHIVSWQRGGRSFKVHKTKEFVEHIMPKNFDLAKMINFFLQLNFWGFKRFSKGPYEGGWYHDKFLKGNISLARGMTPRRVKGTPSNTEYQPNLNAILESRTNISTSKAKNDKTRNYAFSKTRTNNALVMAAPVKKNSTNKWLEHTPIVSPTRGYCKWGKCHTTRIICLECSGLEGRDLYFCSKSFRKDESLNECFYKYHQKMHKKYNCDNFADGSDTAIKNEDAKKKLSLEVQLNQNYGKKRSSSRSEQRGHSSKIRTFSLDTTKAENVCAMGDNTMNSYMNHKSIPSDKKGRCSWTNCPGYIYKKTEKPLSHQTNMICKDCSVIRGEIVHFCTSTKMHLNCHFQFHRCRHLWLSPSMYSP